jgi:hypothetical protein
MGAKEGTPVPAAMASTILRVLPVGEKNRDCTEFTGLAVITNLHLDQFRTPSKLDRHPVAGDRHCREELACAPQPGAMNDFM